METHSKSNLGATETTLEGNKYYPPILEKTFQKCLWSTVNQVNSQKKHEFLNHLHDSFKHILSCNKCSGILKENSVGFSCGHNFCEECSKNIDSCLNCNNDGCQSVCELGNLSEILCLINKIRISFNAESVFLEMLKFLLTPEKLWVKKEAKNQKSRIAVSTPSVPQDNDQKSNKFTSSGKRFKTLLNKTENTKRKLKFNRKQNNSPSHVEHNCFENDSECLFVNPKIDDDTCKKQKINSYLEQQMSIADSPNFLSIKTYSRKLKRKFCDSAEKNRDFDKLLKEQDYLKNKKIKRISESSEYDFKFESGKCDCNVNNVIDNPKIKIKRRSSQRLNEVKNVDVDAETLFEGTFLGFSKDQLLKSYCKLKNAILISQIGDANEENIKSVHVKKTLSRIRSNRTKKDSVQQKCDEGSNRNFQCKISSLLQKNFEVNPVKNMKTEKEPKTVVENTRKQKNSVQVNLKSNSSGDEQKQPTLRAAHDIDRHFKSLNDSEQQCEDIITENFDQNVRKEKENLLLNLPDTDADEVLDINIWEKNDKVCKKKKSLFKSVKERNRKSLLFVQNEDIQPITKSSVISIYDRSNALTGHLKTSDGIDSLWEDMPETKAEKITGERILHVNNFICNNSEIVNNTTVNEERGSLNSNTVLCSDTKKRTLPTTNKNQSNKQMFSITCTNEDSVKLNLDFISANIKEGIQNNINTENLNHNIMYSVCDIIDRTKCNEDGQEQNKNEKQTEEFQKDNYKESDEHSQYFTDYDRIHKFKNRNRKKSSHDFRNMKTGPRNLTVKATKNQTGNFKTRKYLRQGVINDNKAESAFVERDHERNFNGFIQNLNASETNVKNQVNDFSTSTLKRTDGIKMTEQNEKYLKHLVDVDESYANICENKNSENLLNMNRDVKLYTICDELGDKDLIFAGESLNSASVTCANDIEGNNIEPKSTLHIVQSPVTNSEGYFEQNSSFSQQENKNKLVDVHVCGVKISESQNRCILNNSLAELKYSFNSLPIFANEKCKAEIEVQCSSNKSETNQIADTVEYKLRELHKSTEFENTGSEEMAEKILEQNELTFREKSLIISNFKEINESISKNNDVIAESVKTDIRSKCVNLKRIIYDQNQKSLMNIKKNFKISSPNSLSVQKSKAGKNASLTPKDDTCYDLITNYPLFSNCAGKKLDNNVYELSSDRDTSSLTQEESSLNIINSFDTDKLNRIQLLPLIESETNEEMQTLPSSLPAKSVACQTTPDLHIALLIKEFPHIFKESDLLLNIYDTPVESVKAGRNFEQLKTPQTPLLDHREMYTLVSSVNTSEEKVYEKEFASRSVLYNSPFRSPISYDKSTSTLNENVSCFSLLPSTGKKSSLPLNSPISEKRKLSVQLNFQNNAVESKDCTLDVSVENSPSVSMAVIQNVKPIHVLEPIKNQNDVTYCSGLRAVSLNCSVMSADCNESLSKNKPFLNKQSNESNGSNEINFEDYDIIGGGTNTDNEKRSNEDNSKNCSNTVLKEVFDSDDIVGSYDTVVDATKLDSSVVEKKNSGSEEIIFNDPTENYNSSTECDYMNVDDDDVDFVAGTPTCYAKRCVDDSLEKLKTQSVHTKTTDTDNVIPLTEKSDCILFDSAGSKNQKSQSMISNLYPIVETSENIFFANEEKNIAVRSVENLVKSTNCSSDEATMYMATSGLKEIETNIVKLFCEKFRAVLLDKLTEKCSYLIVKTDNKNYTCRTFKYLQAVVNCVSIVSVKWLRDCIDCNQILNIEKYIPFDSSGECGPLRAYNVKTGLTPSPLSWLCDYCILFIEPVPQACTLAQLVEIITKTGAVVVNSIKDFQKYPVLHHVIIISDEEENSEISNTQIAQWIQMYQAVAIEFNWLLEVMGRNRQIPFAEYEFVEIPNNLLIQLNFPAEMLQFESGDTQDSD